MLFLDVANTLLHKPKLWDAFSLSLEEHGIEVELEEVKVKHKICSEIIKFPDKTSKEFYEYFNSELLLSLGIKPKKELLDSIFNKCSYLPWEPFNDVECLKECKKEISIISNWDKSLEKKLKEQFDLNFKYIIGSGSLGFCKPDIRIFEYAKKVSGCAYSQMFFVGDSIKLDILPAEELGIKAILIDRDNVYPNYTGERIISFSELEKYV